MDGHSDSEDTIFVPQRTQPNKNQYEFSTDLGLVLPPVSCGFGCKRLWGRKSIHMNKIRITTFDDSLATHAETKPASARRFKAFLFEKCDSSVDKYRLVCKLAGIDYVDPDSVISFSSVLKVKKIFNEIMERQLLHVLN
jgi:hypothetical protein